MSLNSADYRILVQTIIEKLMELKAAKPMSWKAQFALGMLMSYLEEEAKRKG